MNKIVSNFDAPLHFYQITLIKNFGHLSNPLICSRGLCMLPYLAGLKSGNIVIPVRVFKHNAHFCIGIIKRYARKGPIEVEGVIFEAAVFVIIHPPRTCMCACVQI